MFHIYLYKKLLPPTNDSLIDYSDTFYNSDPRYVHIISMTINDLGSVLNKITSTQIEASNLIDHIHKPRNNRDKISCWSWWMMKMLNQRNKISSDYMIAKLINQRFGMILYPYPASPEA